MLQCYKLFENSHVFYKYINLRSFSFYFVVCNKVDFQIVRKVCYK